MVPLSPARAANTPRRWAALVTMLFLAAVGADESSASTPGCGLAPPGGALPGATIELPFAFGGLARSFFLHLPARYNPSAPTPLVLMFHGYGHTGAGMAAELRDEADASTFIVIAPTGKEGPEPSWNGGGSSDSPGAQGPTCIPGSDGVCYDSCEARAQGCSDCDWTTCLDDVAFVSALLDFAEDSICVDTARKYASNPHCLPQHDSQGCV